MTCIRYKIITVYNNYSSALLLIIIIISYKLTIILFGTYILSVIACYIQLQ